MGNVKNKEKEYLFYNDKIKKWFIKESKNLNKKYPSKYYVENIFLFSKRKEEQLGKDLCFFSYEEVMDLLFTMEIKSLTSLIMIKNVLVDYYIFCYRENITTNAENVFTMLQTKDLERCLKIFTYFSEQDIFNLCTESKYGIRNDCDRFIIRAVFEGIRGREYQDIWNLKLSDFKEYSTGKYIVTTQSEKTLEVSPILHEYAKLSVESEVYYTYGTTEKEIKFIDNGNIVKTIRKDAVKLNTVLNRMIDRCLKSITWDNADIPLGDYAGLKDFYESGIVCFMKKRIKELNMSFEEYVNSNYIVPDLAKRGKGIGVKPHFLSKYGSFME